MDGYGSRVFRMVRVGEHGNELSFQRPHKDINTSVCMCVFVLGAPIVNTFVQAVMGYFKVNSQLWQRRQSSSSSSSEWNYSYCYIWKKKKMIFWGEKVSCKLQEKSWLFSTLEKLHEGITAAHPPTHLSPSHLHHCPSLPFEVIPTRSESHDTTDKR